MFGGMMHLQAFGQDSCFGSRECFIQQRNHMGIQVIGYKANLLGAWVSVTQQPADFFGPVHLCAAIMGIGISPSRQGLTEHKNGALRPAAPSSARRNPTAGVCVYLNRRRGTPRPASPIVFKNRNTEYIAYSGINF